MFSSDSWIQPECESSWSTTGRALLLDLKECLQAVGVFGDNAIDAQFDHSLHGIDFIYSPDGYGKTFITRSFDDVRGEKFVADGQLVRPNLQGGLDRVDRLVAHQQ